MGWRLLSQIHRHRNRVLLNFTVTFCLGGAESGISLVSAGEPEFPMNDATPMPFYGLSIERRGKWGTMKLHPYPLHP